MASINISGRKFSGSNVVIQNGIVTVDGVTLDGSLEGVVEIKIEGTLKLLKTDSSVSMVGEILGNVDAGGSVTAGNVKGSIDAGGSVVCSRN